jgi:biopolymer transport protein ExbD
LFSWDDSPDLNITPLVDVMLVLMAILMVTAPTITFQEQITLPQGSKSVQVEKAKNLTIRIDKDKKIYLNKDTYSLDTFADDFLNLSHNLDKKSEVYIRADEELKYKYVMFLLQSIKSSGFEKVSLLTQ